MRNIIRRDFYLVKVEAISKCLYNTFKKWGYHCGYKKSSSSSSCYLYVSLGTRENPKTLIIRIADHSRLSKINDIKIDWDIYSNYPREDAVSYIKFIEKISIILNKPFPSVLKNVKSGTLNYKNYTLKMQLRGRLVKRKSYYKSKDRLYV